ncbi:XisH family protein [Candidatus Amarolinea aalborgensis]|jgi:hypothetical protein|uniref:XisH family protein n=1 Tax=Candidatus Amarolinea aalborgensis TaxID=2249329 RepID=UPI003BF95DCE
MPAKDIIHRAVRTALEKDGWVITDDPLFVSFAQVQMYIDLGAERLLAAEKNGHKIAVEIKSFLGSSALSEFHLALGQFLSYRLALETQQPDRTLYLAIPSDAYHGFFRLEFGQMIVQRYQIRLIVFDVQNEVIYKWQP